VSSEILLLLFRAVCLAPICKGSLKSSSESITVSSLISFPETQEKLSLSAEVDLDEELGSTDEDKVVLHDDEHDGKLDLIASEVLPKS